MIEKPVSLRDSHSKNVSAGDAVMPRFHELGFSQVLHEFDFQGVALHGASDRSRKVARLLKMITDDAATSLLPDRCRVGCGAGLHH